MIAGLYLGLCVLLAVTLNAANRFIRAAGTLIAAAARCSTSEIWATMHDAALPLIFYGKIVLHLGAVLMHHFIDHRSTDVRRMLR